MHLGCERTAHTTAARYAYGAEAAGPNFLAQVPLFSSPPRAALRGAPRAYRSEKPARERPAESPEIVLRTPIFLSFQLVFHIPSSPSLS